MIRLKLLKIFGVAFVMVGQSLLWSDTDRGLARQNIFEQLYVDQPEAYEKQNPLAAISPNEVSVIKKEVPFSKFSPLLENKLKSLFGEWKQLFAKDLKIAKTAAGVKFHEFKGFNKYYSSESTMDVGVEWRFAIKWPWIKNVQYSGATSIVIATVQMTGEPNLVHLEPIIKLGLGKGWQPEDHDIALMSKGFSRAWVQRKSRELIAEIVELTFKYWGGVVNKLLAEKVDPLLPKVDGQVQQLKLVEVTSDKSSITARFSRLTLNVKELIKSQIPAEEYPRLTVTGVQFSPDQATLTLQMQFLSPPSNITAVAGDSAGTISWDPVETAISYNLFWSTSPFMAPSTKVEGVGSPYTLTGLSNGTTYYVAVSAVDSVGESGYSPPTNFSPAGATVEPQPDQPDSGDSEADSETESEVTPPASSNDDNPSEVLKPVELPASSD